MRRQIAAWKREEKRLLAKTKTSDSKVPPATSSSKRPSRIAKASTATRSSS